MENTSQPNLKLWPGNTRVFPHRTTMSKSQLKNTNTVPLNITKSPTSV